MGDADTLQMLNVTIAVRPRNLAIRAMKHALSGAMARAWRTWNSREKVSPLALAEGIGSAVLLLRMEAPLNLPQRSGRDRESAQRRAVGVPERVQHRRVVDGGQLAEAAPRRRDAHVSCEGAAGGFDAVGVGRDGCLWLHCPVRCRSVGRFRRGLRSPVALVVRNPSLEHRSRCSHGTGGSKAELRAMQFGSLLKQEAHRSNDGVRALRSLRHVLDLDLGMCRRLTDAAEWVAKAEGLPLCYYICTMPYVTARVQQPMQREPCSWLIQMLALSGHSLRSAGAMCGSLPLCLYAAMPHLECLYD